MSLIFLTKKLLVNIYLIILTVWVLWLYFPPKKVIWKWEGTNTDKSFPLTWFCMFYFLLAFTSVNVMSWQALHLLLMDNVFLLLCVVGQITAWGRKDRVMCIYAHSKLFWHMYSLLLQLIRLINGKYQISKVCHKLLLGLN